MNEIVSIVILIGVILYQGWMHYDQRRAYEGEIGNLLDRLMAKDYPMYIQGEVAKKEVDRLTPEEVFELEREKREQGIPI